MRLKNVIHASTYIRGYPMLTLCIADVERDAGMKNLNRKEAMEILNDMKVKIEIPKAAVMQNKRNAALDMAITALELFGNSEQLPSIQSNQQTIVGQKSDLIHRETARRIIDSPRSKSQMLTVLKCTPPVQPDRSLWFRIGEVCVGESKGDISAEMAVEKIRELLREAERRKE